MSKLVSDCILNNPDRSSVPILIAVFVATSPYDSVTLDYRMLFVLPHVSVRHETLIALLSFLEMLLMMGLRIQRIYNESDGLGLKIVLVHLGGRHRWFLHARTQPSRLICASNRTVTSCLVPKNDTVCLRKKSIISLPYFF